MNIPSFLSFFVASALFLAAPHAGAAVKLPAVIGDHMVLQRDEPVRLWGWDDAGTEVTVTLGEANATAKAGDDGKWAAELPAMKAGGPHTLTVKGSSEVEVKDVLVGEVWLASGQSNMEWAVAQSNDAQKEVAGGDHPRIRHLKVQHVPADAPREDVVSNGWQVASPATVGGFTAVGYYFARELEGELDVPVGIIGSNWGGTRIEPWIPSQGFRQVEALKDITEKLDSFPSKNEKGEVNHQTPLALYNGMIAPLVPYGIRGAIWYQGESNNGEGMLYHEKMKALIAGWRDLWHDEAMPFLFVQLAPYRYTQGQAFRGTAESLPGIWEAQLKTLSVPHTGMAVTVDIGNVKDIHPGNKQDVGKRLALWALATVYGKAGLVHSGPLYKSVEFEGSRARVSFDHVGGGLVSRDGKPLTHFQVAGEDRKWVDAQAEVDGETVVVSADGVSEPVAVRFAWHEEAEPNLSNKEGLPASPFRTGNW